MGKKKWVITHEKKKSKTIAMTESMISDLKNASEETGYNESFLATKCIEISLPYVKKEFKIIKK